MTIKKIIRIIFQIPIWLFLITSIFATWYGYNNKITTSLFLPIFVTIIVSLYFFARIFLKDKNNNEEYVNNIDNDDSNYFDDNEDVDKLEKNTISQQLGY